MQQNVAKYMSAGGFLPMASNISDCIYFIRSQGEPIWRKAAHGDKTCRRVVRLYTDFLLNPTVPGAEMLIAALDMYLGERDT